jgi:hypothetical protein
MHGLSRLALPVAVLALAALVSAVPDDPAPLLKPVVPQGSGVRVRVPVHTGNVHTDSQLKARVANSKTGETIDVTVAFDTLPGKSHVSTKKWKSWGFEVPANKIGVLPELVIPATQLAPKPSKGRDVEVKFAAVALEIVDPPAGSDLVFGSDLSIRLSELTKNADRTFEPRFYFGDTFLELTVPGGTVKRPGTGDGTPPEPAVNSDAKLVPVSGPMVVRRAPVFAFASINGLPRYKTPDGKFETVTVGVSSNTNWPGGVMMTLGTARGCGVEIDEAKETTGAAATAEKLIVKGRVKEFRLGFQAGTGFEDQKDLVLKDVTVYVDKTNSGHFVWLGTKFVNENLTDGVYAWSSEGNYRLLGRARPELLQDIKTRTPAKKP